jgi:hypothetical protein
MMQEVVIKYDCFQHFTGYILLKKRLAPAGHTIKKPLFPGIMA